MGESEVWGASNKGGDARLLLVSCDLSKMSGKKITEDYAEFISKYTFNKNSPMPSGGWTRTYVFLDTEYKNAYAIKLFDEYNLIAVLKLRALSTQGAQVFIGQVIDSPGCFEINEDGIKLFSK